MDYFSHVRNYINTHITDTDVVNLATNYIQTILKSNSVVPDGKIILPYLTAKDIRTTPRFWKDPKFTQALMTLVRHRLVRSLTVGNALSTEQLFELADCIDSCTPDAMVMFSRTMDAMYSPTTSYSHKHAYEVSYLG